MREGPAVVVRPMRADDVEAALDTIAVVADEQRWIGASPGFDREERRQRWLAGLDDPFTRQYVVVERDSGMVLGNGGIHRERYGVAEFGMSLVPAARGRGAGGSLLDALIDGARQMRAHKVALQVWPHNEPAIRLYLSRGFVVEGRIRRHYRRASGEHWDAVLMGLLLDPGLPGEEPTLPDGTRLADATSLPAAVRIRD
jgi:RimJ/RimL family protein N-acetyltransferase